MFLFWFTLWNLAMVCRIVMFITCNGIGMHAIYWEQHFDKVSVPMKVTTKAIVGLEILTRWWIRPYKRLQSQGHIKKKKAYCCSKFNACGLSTCWNYSILHFCLCRSTMTLHQGQVHRNEHKHIYAWVYHHAKCGCHSLNTV